MQSEVDSADAVVEVGVDDDQASQRLGEKLFAAWGRSEVQPPSEETVAATRELLRAATAASVVNDFDVRARLPTFVP